jgi:RES domain-containing protein
LSLTLWRISKRKYADAAFSGEGARRVGGRWNSRGQGMVYTSGTLSLAALEVLVHMEIAEMGNTLVAIRAERPTTITIERLEISQLPADWRDIPAPGALAELGDRWFQSRQTVILGVPSAVVLNEYNYLINPSHPDFTHIKLGTPESFNLDSRLWKS